MYPATHVDVWRRCRPAIRPCRCCSACWRPVEKFVRTLIEPGRSTRAVARSRPKEASRLRLDAPGIQFQPDSKKIFRGKSHVRFQRTDPRSNR